MDDGTLMQRDRDVVFARRQAHRSQPGLMMARLESAMADDLCLVCDLSPYGAGLRTARAHRVGDRVRLDFGDALSASGTVRWSDQGRCGIAFDAVVDLAPLFHAGLFRCSGMSGAAPGPAEGAGKRRRGLPRLRRCAGVVLQHGNGHVAARHVAGQLVYISPAGCRIDLAEGGGFAVGDRVRFSIEDRFDCEGEIRWVGAAAVGVAFDPPLRLWKLEKWLVDGLDRCGTCTADGCAAPSFQRALMRCADVAEAIECSQKTNT